MYPQTSPFLSFIEIDTQNLNTIAIADTSVYPVGFNILNATYEIFPPSFPSVSLMYAQSSIEVFNGNNLNISCVTDQNMLPKLPDGIWKIRQTISPADQYKNEKSFLRVANLKHSFGMAFLKTDMVNCEGNAGSEAMKYLMQINAYIEGAIAASNQCNLVLAMDLYRLADKTIKNFNKENYRGIPTRTSWY